MSIPALGGGANPALQRALMEAAERALTDELDLLATGDGTSGTGAAGARTRALRAPTPTPTRPQQPSEAIVVELTDRVDPEGLTVAEGWITTLRRSPIQGIPSPPVPTPPAPPPTGTPAMGRTPAQPTGETVTLEHLIAVLKRTGIDFRDALRVLREIHVGEPLPGRAELKALWAAAPQSGPSPETPETPETRQASGGSGTPSAPRTAELPLDHLIRERSWHRLGAEHAAETAATSSPTLASVTQPTDPNQAYVAGLSTAEFQRLVTVLGAGGAPAWFWQVRGHRGLRALAERPAVAALATTRIAGTRLGAWLGALLGMALLWYVGIRLHVWW